MCLSRDFFLARFNIRMKFEIKVNEVENFSEILRENRSQSGVKRNIIQDGYDARK